MPEAPADKKTSPNILTEPINRRQFLGKSWNWSLGAAFVSILPSFLLPGCSPAKAPETRPTATNIPIPPDLELLGPGEKIKGQYSELVKKYDLVPEIFKKEDSKKVRNEKAIAYLRKLQKALHENPDYKGLPLNKYDLSSETSYPTTIQDGWTISEVLDATIEEISKIKFREGTRPESVMETVSLNEIVLHDALMNDSVPAQVNETKYVYYGRTDATLAFALVHEIAGHIFIGKKFAERYGQQGKASGKDPNQWVLDEMLKENELARQRIRNRDFPGLTSEKKERGMAIIDDRTISEGFPNTVAFFYTDVLCRLNGTNHFPGVEKQDSVEEFTLQVMRQQSSDPRYAGANRYDLFKKYVLSKGGSVLDPRWLVEVQQVQYP